MADIFDFDATVRDFANQLAVNPVFPTQVDLDGITIEVEDFSYIESDPEKKILIIASAGFKNNSDRDDPQRFASSKQTSATYGWSIRQGLSSVKSHNMQVALPAKQLHDIGITITDNDSETITLETTETQGKNFSETWSWDATIPVPARSRIVTNIVLTQIQYATNFTATALFTGEIVVRTWDTDVFGRSKNFNDPNIHKFLLGQFFTRFPHPKITIRDSGTVTTEISGIFGTVKGIGIEVDNEQYAIEN